MIEFFPYIQLTHVVAVQGGAEWGMAAPVRYLCYSVDTLLLTAACVPLTILPAALFANGWPLLKPTLLVAYVGHGTFALKRGRTGALRRACFVSALVVFAGMFLIVRTRDPSGPVRMLQARLT